MSRKRGRPKFKLPKKKALLNLDDPYTLKHLRKEDLIKYNNKRRYFSYFLYSLGGIPLFWCVDKKKQYVGWNRLLTKEEIDYFREVKPF